MAYIKFLESKDIEYLREHHTLGRRADSVDTLLDFPFISKIHAVIEWREPNWLIKDVSRNGVWLNQQRLSPQVRTILKKNDIVKIAGEDGIHFQIENTESPKNMVYQCENKIVSIDLDSGCLIPNDDTPEFGIYHCPDRAQWFAESITTLSLIHI